MAFKGRVDEDHVDYKTLNSTLMDSGLQKDNPALFQVIKSLITGAQTSKNFINDKFGKGDKLNSKLLSGMIPIENGGTLTDQYIPVKTLGLNVLSLGTNELYYYRIGNLVTVFGYLTINPTAAGADTTGWLTLPILSYFTRSWQCAGIGYSDTVNQGITFKADPINNQVKLRFLSNHMGQNDYYITFSYRIVPK